MKNYNFVYTEKSRKISKTYGGSTYTLAVYEIVNNELVYLGEKTACTRGHKGEDSEAFDVVREKRPEVIKTLIKRTSSDEYYNKEAKGNYYTWRFKDFGVSLKKI
jgi:hypothetical protein